jgi:hypothetical protein
MLPDLLEHLIGHMRLGDQSERLRPGQCRALAVRVKRRVAPGIEQIEPLLALAARASRVCR